MFSHCVAMKLKHLQLLLAVILLSGVNVKGQECIPDSDRVDCHPDPGASPATCLARGCTWCEAEVPGMNTPFCFTPRNYGYAMVGQAENTGSGFRVQLRRESTGSMFGNDSETLTLEAMFQSDYRLRIKITDGTPRWEVPLEIAPVPPASSTPMYNVMFTNTPKFSFRVIRRSTGTVIFDSVLGGFTFSNQFIQLAFKLPSRNVYGIGENEQPTFRHDFFGHKKWALWARDQAPDGDANMYGVHPYYTVLEDDGNTHSVAIVNSNAQEFEMLPTPGIAYRTIGGILDMYFFLGPTPESVVQQYTEAVGRAPLPPYWALGFQLCRWGYNTLANMQAAVNRTRQYGIPHDVQYGDIDIMERALDFTYDKINFAGLPEYIRQLKEEGIRFMTILDPAISIGEPTGTYPAYEIGNEMDVWYKKANGEPMVGRVWPADSVVFPDYFNLQTQIWWSSLIMEFQNLLEFDGLWIDMNEPANFVTGDLYEGCADNQWNNPPYLPKIRENLTAKTICSDHVGVLGLHYNTHSLYGWSQSPSTFAATNDAVGKRTFVLSRSTFLGSGRWVSHWLGDNWSKWDNLHFSIIGILQFNQFGIPFVGPDICGFIGNAESEMCQRWMQLGAFYPFSRNHNAIDNIDQDPGVWGPGPAASSKKVLEIRYTLLPYLYTLLAIHNRQGNTVARPLWHEFPADFNAAGVDTQFLWGSGLMVSPVLEQGATTVRAYFPSARFYDYHDGRQMGTRGGFATIDAPLDHINIHIQGGNILPVQEPARNTMLSRNNAFGLIVALDDFGVANGTLFFDRGDVINPFASQLYFWARYSLAGGSLTAVVDHDGYNEMSNKRLQFIRLLGASTVTSISLNGINHPDFFTKPSGEVVIGNLNIPMNQTFTMTYN